MMLNVIAAEAHKLTRHRATWGLVWIYPIALLVIGTIMLIVAASGNAGGPEQAQSAADWADDAADFWNAPGNTLIRFLIAGYVAVAFAGEYGWNTWKLVVPHSSRWKLIASKFIATTLLVLLGLTLGAIVFMAIYWLEDVVSADPIPAGVTAGALLSEHASGVLSALPPILLSIAVAAFASVLTGSMVAALIVTIVFVAVEQLVLNLGPLLSAYMPGVMSVLIHILPGYHLSNIAQWVSDGEALQVMLINSDPVSLSLGTSVTVVAAWILGLVALTFWRFGRQDIN